MIKSLFLAGHEIVICDETNYSLEARQHVQSEDWDIVWYPILTDPAVCKERAVLTKQEYLLPVIDEMYARYTPLGPQDEIFVDVTDKGTVVTKRGAN